MFFVLSKILWKVFTPLTFISLLIVSGYMLRAKRYGRMILTGGVFLLVLCGFFPIGHNLTVYMENLNPLLTEATLPKNVDGIIVLGGAIELERSVTHKQVQMNDNGARMTEMLFLAQHYPKAKLVFSGGSGKLKDSSSSESIETNNLLKHIGFDVSRMMYEDKSRNTYENCIYSKNLVNPKEAETWILVTSGFHMSRAKAIFRTQGWNVIPYPAGYLTEGGYRVLPTLEVLENIYQLQIVSKEVIGIMAYTLTGKIRWDEVALNHTVPAGL